MQQLAIKTIKINKVCFKIDKFNDLLTIPIIEIHNLWGIQGTFLSLMADFENKIGVLWS